MKTLKILLLMLITLVGLGSASPTLACGGLFCQNIPVDQAAERIIFTVDPDTVSAYVQINYTGDAPNFAWVVPVPAVPQVDVAEIEAFNELQAATDPVFMLPPIPDCMFEPVAEMAFEEESMEESEESAADVTVFASGEAGPYAFDVVGTETENASALIDWLNENNYRITPEMEPLVFVYVREKMLFLAMKLQPEQGVQDIQPVKMTYESQRPMIPIRLTAVAAMPNMGIYTWVFGRGQAEAQNYASLQISNDDIQLTNAFAGSTNYLQMVGDGIDRFGGLAFITEYAQPSSELAVVDPLLRELRQKYPYVTRVYGQLSPEEMTVDPVFDFNNQLPDISNVRDLTYRTDLYPCNIDDNDNGDETSIVISNNDQTEGLADIINTDLLTGAILATCLILLGTAIGGGVVWLGRRR